MAAVAAGAISSTGREPAAAGAAAALPGALVLAPSGDVHAMHTKFVHLAQRCMLAASHLPAADTISLVTRGNDGTARNGRPACGAQDNGPSRTQAVPGAVLAPAARPGSDGLLHLGITATASTSGLQSGGR